MKFPLNLVRPGYIATLTLNYMLIIIKLELAKDHKR